MTDRFRRDLRYLLLKFAILEKTCTASFMDGHKRPDALEPTSLTIYKIIHGPSTVNFSYFVEFSHHDRTRDHSLKLQKNRVITDLRRHLFSGNFFWIFGIHWM